MSEDFTTWHPSIILPLNAVVKLPDGRIGTICYNNLDGQGGIWGEYRFKRPANSFSDDLPKPEFMLRESYVGQTPGIEYVGDKYLAIHIPQKNNEIRARILAGDIVDGDLQNEPLEISVVESLIKGRILTFLNREFGDSPTK